MQNSAVTLFTNVIFVGNVIFERPKFIARVFIILNNAGQEV